MSETRYGRGDLIESAIAGEICVVSPVGADRVGVLLEGVTLIGHGLKTKYKATARNLRRGKDHRHRAFGDGNEAAKIQTARKNGALCAVERNFEDAPAAVIHFVKIAIVVKGEAGGLVKTGGERGAVRAVGRVFV